MKTKTLKLLMAALMLGTTLYVSANPNDDGGGGGHEDNYPHRSPGNHSFAIQVSLDASNNLSVAFNLEDSEVSILIYKDGVLIFSGVDSVEPGDIATFNLSSYGSGLYEVIVDCSDTGEYASETFLIGEP